MTGLLKKSSVHESVQCIAYVSKKVENREFNVKRARSNQYLIYAAVLFFSREHLFFFPFAIWIYQPLPFDRTTMVVLVKLPFKVDNRCRAAYEMSIIEAIFKDCFICIILQREFGWHVESWVEEFAKKSFFSGPWIHFIFGFWINKLIFY